MNAHDAILQWCRSVVHGHGHPCMRNGHKESPPCLVIDVDRTEPKPGGHSWERRSVVIAEGATWEEIADKLGIEYDAPEPIESNVQAPYTTRWEE